MPVERRKIERGLLKKGFVKGKSPHHRYFHHEVDGKRTGIYTYTSHGIREYGAELLRSVRRQLKLDTGPQLLDFIECPMSAAAYNAHLREKGIKLD